MTDFVEDYLATKCAGLPMPDRFYKAERNKGYGSDVEYIHEQLSRMTITQRARAAEAYSEAYADESSRYDCNSRLRRFAERCEAINKGAVSMPPIERVITGINEPNGN